MFIRELREKLDILDGGSFVDHELLVFADGAEVHIDEVRVELSTEVKGGLVIRFFKEN